MSFSVNTNIASLQAQNYLRVNSDFQSKTIYRVTSGLRIISSGDDAAGLAIANGFRSDQAVLTQGIRNANDGLSTLQTIDGGMNNISQLLDRARTLATQSASGTFTGSRDVLNQEFQSVINEIDRQAQAIGMNEGGDFAKSLSVFIGGGRGSSVVENGSINLDLGRSTVDAKSLGLKGVQAAGTAATDISAASDTSVAKILADTTNTGSEAVGGFTDFYFQGPGFGDSGKVRVSVNLAGVTDTDTLVDAINNAITAAGNGATAAATAFKNSGITASIHTDSAGRKQLSFSSSKAAFQVQAGDRVSNALLGNFSSGVQGKDLSASVQGTAVTAAGTLSQNVIIRIQGSGLASPVDLQLDAGISTATALGNLSSLVANNSALQAAGITLSGTDAVGQQLKFSNERGEQFTVSAVGDTGNLLKLGTYANSSAAGISFDYTSTEAAYNGATGGTVSLQFSVGGGADQSISVTVGAGDSIQTTVDQFNTAILGNNVLKAAGLKAEVNGGNIRFTSSNGTAFRLNETADDASNILAFATGAAGNATLASVAADNTNNVHFDSAGAAATKVFEFNPILNGQDAQTLTFSAIDATGGSHSVAVVLKNDATTPGTTVQNARSLDEAVHTINKALQQSNDSTMQQIVAVKEYDSTSHKEGIKFVSTLHSFNVGVGQAGTGGAVGVGVAADQGDIYEGKVVGEGSTADISSQASAQSAVSALAEAVASLGSAQAAIGKGQNNLNFAINLAQSQLSNIAAAESRIRDADLAAEAANLTKAQILLQAGTAALAQANSAPQAILSLLRG